MFDAVEELRVRARLLHKRNRSTDPEAKLKHALAEVAKQHGFDSWAHATRVLEGTDEPDFGTLLYPKGCGGFLNAWYADHETATAHREENGGYLLAYKRQYLVVTRAFIETLGLDPDDPDWDRIGWDWAEPRDPQARRRLYAKLIAPPQFDD